MQLLPFKEENNNTVSNQNQSVNEESFSHSQLLQTLTTGSANDHHHSHHQQQQTTNSNTRSDSHDNLIALNPALRSTANGSPLPTQSSIRQLNNLPTTTARNQFAANANISLLNGKLLTSNINDLDSLSIGSNRPLRPPDLKGNFLFDHRFKYWNEWKSFFVYAQQQIVCLQISIDEIQNNIIVICVCTVKSSGSVWDFDVRNATSNVQHSIWLTIFVYFACIKHNRHNNV